MADLSPNQEKGALLIAEGTRFAEVARLCGVSTTSLKRWRRIPAFIELVKKLRSDATKEAIDFMRDNLVHNVGIIQSIADGAVEQEAMATRLNAAKWLTERILKPIEKETTVAVQDGRKAAREAVAEIERLTAEDAEDLLSRGL